MAIKSLSDLNEIHLSVLAEIGNIGSGNAATSLSQVLSQPVDMSTPEVGIANFNEAYEKLGGPETVTMGVLLMLKGDMKGMIMFLLPNDATCTVANLMASTDFKNYNEITEMGFSAVCEMANIMSGAFVNAIADMTGMFIDISPPSYTIDMLGGMLNLPAIHFAEVGDLFMYIKNDLEIAGKRTPANILLVPDMESLDKLMSVLGIE